MQALAVRDLVPQVPRDLQKKMVFLASARQGRDLELRYFRDRDGRKVDFVVTENRKPILLVEAKSSDVDVDTSLLYLLARCPSMLRCAHARHRARS